jgi:hypothetical protein
MENVEGKIAEEQKLKEEFSKYDPITQFHILSDLRAQGIDPVEIGLIPGNPVTKKVPSGAKMAEKLVKRATAAAEDWVEGVKHPSRDPIEAAIAAKDKFVDRLTTAIKEGRWEGGLKKVTHADIVKVVDKLGSRVFSDGLEARSDKIIKVFNELQPMFQSVSDTIQAMPDKTDADREKRLLTARKLMIEVGKKRKAGGAT